MVVLVGHPSIGLANLAILELGSGTDTANVNSKAPPFFRIVSGYVLSVLSVGSLRQLRVFPRAD